MDPSWRADDRICLFSRRFSSALIAAALLVFAAPFIALLFYSSMNTDDFTKAAWATLTGNVWRAHPTLLPVVQWEYTNGTGRWLTSLLENLLFHQSNLVTSYGWLLLLVMLTNVAALAYFFSSFLRVPRKQALFVACIFYAVWLVNVTGPGESVFWLTAAFEYQLPISAMLVFAGLLCSSNPTISGDVALAMLAFAIPALHELAGAFLLVILLAGLIAAVALKMPARRWLLCLVLIVISNAVIMLSPAKRVQFAFGHHKVPWSVAYALPYAKHTAGLGVAWITNPAVLLSTLCMALLLWPPAGSSAGSGYRPPRWLALAGLGAMGVLILEYAGAEITSGYGQLPPRTVGWFEFVFWLLFACVILTGMPEIAGFSPGTRVGISLLFVVSLLGSGHFHAAEADWRGPARSYWASSIARLRQRDCAVEFEPLPPKPTLFKPPSVSTDPQCWINQVAALYLRANTVVSKDPNENPNGCW